MVVQGEVVLSLDLSEFRRFQQISMGLSRVRLIPGEGLQLRKAEISLRVIMRSSQQVPLIGHFKVAN